MLQVSLFCRQLTNGVAAVRDELSYIPDQRVVFRTERFSMNKYVLATAALMLTVPANATTVLDDNFDSENGGNSGLQNTGFDNFIVDGGVDVISSGDFGINCVGGSGSCVDLDGSPGPGALESAASFAFNPGDMVRLSVDISGNQRNVFQLDEFGLLFDFLQDTSFTDTGFNFFGSDTFFPDSGMRSAGGQFGASSFVEGGDPFLTRSIFFTAETAGSLAFRIESPSNDNVGPIIDNVLLQITPQVAAAVPEPATWLMMILGFAFVGGTMRAKRRKQNVSVSYA